MSFTVKIDPIWYVDQVAAGKTDEQILEEIDAMFDSAMRRAGERVQKEILAMMQARADNSA